MLAVGPLGPHYCRLFAWYKLGRHAHLGRRYPPTIPQTFVGGFSCIDTALDKVINGFGNSEHPSTHVRAMAITFKMNSVSNRCHNEHGLISSWLFNFFHCLHLVKVFIIPLSYSHDKRTVTVPYYNTALS